MGLWKTFHCCQYLACNEGYGYVSISSFPGVARKQAFMAAGTRCCLASFVYYLPGCFCGIPCPGSLSTQLTSCIFYHHYVRTGINNNVHYNQLSWFVHKGDVHGPNLLISFILHTIPSPPHINVNLEIYLTGVRVSFI